MGTNHLEYEIYCFVPASDLNMPSTDHMGLTVAFVMMTVDMTPNDVSNRSVNSNHHSANLFLDKPGMIGIVLKADLLQDMIEE